MARITDLESSALKTEKRGHDNRIECAVFVPPVSIPSVRELVAVVNSFLSPCGVAESSINMSSHPPSTLLEVGISFVIMCHVMRWSVEGSMFVDFCDSSLYSVLYLLTPCPWWTLGRPRRLCSSSNLPPIVEEQKFSTGNRRLVDYFDNGRGKWKGRCRKTKR